MEVLNIMVENTKLSMRDFVHQNIFGRLTMDNSCAARLATMAAVCEGDHIEIGVAHGGSAILCAYAKKLTKTAGIIYGVDPLEGYVDPARNPVPPEPTYDNVVRNFELHSVEDKIKLYAGYHPPLPAELRNKTFVSAFIDGEHDYISTMKDWLNLKDKVSGMVAFHDVDSGIWGCNTVFKIAEMDKDWERYELYGQIGILKRKDFTPTPIKELYERLGVEYIDPQKD